ncbi:FAD-dependent oxidoreductase [bacterium]|nr:FAD-dependent oxidoreductase [bacterium]
MGTDVKIIVVGGVAGGASAAARARRLSEKSEIIIFERGEYVSFANCGLPYHIGGIIKKRKKLLIQTPESFKKRFNVDVKIKSEVMTIDRKNKTVKVKNIDTGEQYNESYDFLVLSPGAEPFRPPLKGIDNARVFTLRNMPDMDRIKKAASQTVYNNAVVIGGGYIGLEMAECLREINMDVTVVELDKQVMTPVDPEMAVPLQDHLQEKGVSLKLSDSVEKFIDNGDSLIVETSKGDKIKCDFAVLSVGVKPDIAFVKQADIAIGSRGGIKVDENMLTNDPCIFAVGDTVEVDDFVGGFKTLIPLAGPANRQGRIAADNIFGRKTQYKKTQGTAICKIFDLTVGMTGLNEKSLKRKNFDYEKIYLHNENHADYYPGATPMSMKVLFDRNNGKLLGAQVIGREGVDKRTDVLAVAIRAGLTVSDLQDLELTYAPPYGSAKDPVNYAGFIAGNYLSGDVRICHFDDIKNKNGNQIVLDVRTVREFEAGHIPDSLFIPLNELRERLNEIPRDKECLVICYQGLRAYIACRILSQNGFKCKDLSGGYKTYCWFDKIGK